MDMRFVPVEFSAIADAMREHLAELPSAIDSFLEDHIMASHHYRIEIAGETAGFASIHDQALITQFAVMGRFRHYGQAAFREVRRLEQVRAAYVPTSDGFYLAHALDDFRSLAKQAYLFALSSDDVEPVTRNDLSLLPATAEDAAAIRLVSGDFFAHIEQQIAARQIFITRRGDEPVGYGIVIKSALYEDVASIGMFTREEFRGQGVGTATIALLIAECRASKLRPVAGCWYYNHASKRTLERAGMVTTGRLLKVSF